MDTAGEAADVTEDVVGSQDGDNPEDVAGSQDGDNPEDVAGSQDGDNPEDVAGSQDGEKEVVSTVWPREFSELPQGEAQTSASMTAWLKDGRNQNFHRWQKALLPKEKDWPELIYVITILSHKSSILVKYYLKRASDTFLLKQEDCLGYLLTLEDRQAIAAAATADILLGLEDCQWIEPLTDWTQKACTRLVRKSAFNWKKIERNRQNKARKALGQGPRKAAAKKKTAFLSKKPANKTLSTSANISVSAQNAVQAPSALVFETHPKRKTDDENDDQPQSKKANLSERKSRIRVPKSESTLSDREPTPFPNFPLTPTVRSKIPGKGTTRTNFPSKFATPTLFTLPEKRSEMLYQECIEVLVKDIGEEDMELDDPDSLIISLSCCIKEEAKGFQHSYIRAVHLDFDKFCSALEGLDEAFRIGTEKELRWLNWDGEERIVKDVYDFQFAVGQMWMMKNEDERNMVMRIHKKKNIDI